MARRLRHDLLCCLIAMSSLALCAWLNRSTTQDEPIVETFGAVRAEAFLMRDGSIQRSRTFQKIRNSSDEINAEYGFVNFNDDVLKLSVVLTQKEITVYGEEYGYTKADLDSLLDWQRKAVNDAVQHAVKNSLRQSELNRITDEIKTEYRRKYRELLTGRGFRFISASKMVPDIPAVVRRNVVHLHPCAIAVNKVAESRDYGSDEIIGASLSLVQTAIRYEKIPGERAGRKTGGINPPLVILAEGKGDCDSKTALLAGILLNWDGVQLVAVQIPNHYLLGVLRNPRKGEAFVESKGLRYVLIEPAGPGWLPPGSVAASTLDIVNSGHGVAIEPLAAKN